MKRAGFTAAAIGLICTLCLGFTLLTVAAQPADHPPTFENLQGEVVLDNPRVTVEKFVLQPGQNTGKQSHRLDQLWVFVKGGVLTSEGRAVLWRDGRVLWRRAADRPDEGSTNTGTTPIEVICVNLKPWPSTTTSTASRRSVSQLPEHPGRGSPGERSGDRAALHRESRRVGGSSCPSPRYALHPHQGWAWAVKTSPSRSIRYPNASPDGEVGWMPTIDLSVGHQSGNVGKEPIDLIWVTLKK